jgi:hypothetical protein
MSFTVPTANIVDGFTPKILEGCMTKVVDGRTPEILALDLRDTPARV